jgi:hypothetical protein
MCSSPVLSEAVHGAFRVMSVQNFGCAGDFAYLWATVGTNEQRHWRDGSLAI